jgi:RHS repeat-associated protein
MTDLWQSTSHIPGYYHGTATYAANGAVTSLGGVPGYSTLTYGLDGEGRPKTATQGAANLVTGVTYNAASQPKTVSLGAGDSDNYVYDPNTNRMTKYTFTVGSTPKSQVGSPTWNLNGTLRSLAITDGFNSGGAQTCNFGTSSVPGYDELGRLLSVNCGSSVWSQSFSYDPFDNITKSGSLNWAPGYNLANNRALSPFTYDNNGNMTSDSANTYAWYVDNKLGSINSTTCTIFGSSDGTCILYDAFGREVERGVNGTYQEIMYTPVGKTAIMNGQSTPVNAYFPLPGGQTYDQTGTADGSGYFWHKDWLGSVRLASSVQNRTVYFDRAFAPYGEMYTNFGNTGGLDFTGDTQDSFSGLLFDTPNRELSSSEGRWLSPDPAGAGWNLYAYVSNNPLGLVDPSGLGPDNPHWENFDARVYVFDSSFDASLNPGDAFIQAAIQGFQVQAGLNSPMQQGAAVYQSCVALNFNCDMNGQPAAYNMPALIEAQKEALADAMSIASKSSDGSNWDAIYAGLSEYDQDGNVKIQGGHVDFAWTGDSTLLPFVSPQDWETGGCVISCRYGSVDAIHFNNGAFHLDTAGVNWGYGLGAFLHLVFDVGLGNNPGNVPMNPIVF